MARKMLVTSSLKPKAMEIRKSLGNMIEKEREESLSLARKKASAIIQNAESEGRRVSGLDDFCRQPAPRSMRDYPNGRVDNPQQRSRIKTKNQQWDEEGSEGKKRVD